ncbi:MAG: hypothetical protein M1541_00875 [Acidobacteria bacterium]|nr:hypothetical protein [Acidobacteriota bacterium]
MRALAASPAVWLLAAALLRGGEQLNTQERIEIVRGLTAEFATAKVQLPRSKKALAVELDGKFDPTTWDIAGKEHGPAARGGDLVQVTKVTIGDDRLVLEINGGFKGGRKWYQNVEIGMGGTMPVGGPRTSAPGGTVIALLFHKPVPALKASEIKKILAPVLDFEKHSATEQYVETLPAPIRKAIKEQRAIEGMDRDQVLLSMGRPRTKVRETKDGEEFEDWIYGLPPGKLTFVTFHGSKVVRVKESYAGLGGETVTPPAPPI